jgi:hypothetical protein
VTTREQWLGSATNELRSLFAPIAELPPKIHVSVGFPSKHALARKKQRIGECWSQGASADGNCHILISPVLALPIDVLDVLTHELVHVVAPGAGHKGKFISISRAVGLTANKPTSAGAGPELRERLDGLAKSLGDWPGSALRPSLETDKEKTQSTRMIKAACSCGYTVRLTRKWLEIGPPICPACEIPLEASLV